MVGVIEAFRIIRKNKMEFENWTGRNVGKLFAILIIGISIPLILSRIILPLYDISPIGRFIIVILFSLPWGILWWYYLCAQAIKELNLTLD